RNSFISFRLRRTIIHRAEMDRRHNWLMFIRLCSIRYGLTEYLRSWDTIPIVSLIIRRTTRSESCPTRERARHTDRARAIAYGRVEGTKHVSRVPESGGPFRYGRWWFPELRFSLAHARSVLVKVGLV